MRLSFSRVHILACECVRRSKINPNSSCSSQDLPRGVWFLMSLLWLPNLPSCLVPFFLWLTRQKEIQCCWNLISLSRPRVSGFNPCTSAGILIPALHAVAETAQSLAQCRVSWRQTAADLSFPDHLFIESIHQVLSHGRSLALGCLFLAQTQPCRSFCCSALMPPTPCCTSGTAVSAEE